MEIKTSKANLVQGAYQRLKGDILASRLAPGYQATEPEIAERLGMSRTPVREALLMLQADGLIKLIPRRGAQVVPISMSDMRDIYEILTTLEPEAAARVAADGVSAADLADLEAANDDMEHALASGDLDWWAAADDRFHQKLLELQKNRRLTEFVTRLFDQAHRIRILTLRLREPPHRSTEEHRQILRHIKAGEADAVRSVFREHRRRAACELLSILETYKFPSL